MLVLTAKNACCNLGRETFVQVLHSFGFLNRSVRICSLPGIKGHPCNPNEATLGHFRVNVCLLLKASLSAKFFAMVISSTLHMYEN